ncbi:hypothetical protein [Flavobacterium sp. F52]|uniref:hypothetical protein n=1 Tax=Flavobacterium sp. F52 TaxID=1202532 RepID=UPI000272DC0B|nr:hypothetical protein [Flavobacterium sp. F52]EJG02256.1 hypothetical protein FF52_06235 [Flavobacterium sp. F52]
MFDETKKSVESILSQRLSSPFYGTLIISWLIWNWKIIYLTIFVSEDTITVTKIQYIIQNYSEEKYIVWFPLLSTFLLLTVVPFITNGAYWLDLLFTNWRESKKQSVQNKQMLSLEQSVKIRAQIVQMEKEFKDLLSDRDNEIEQLKSLLNQNPNHDTIIYSNDDDEDEGYYSTEIDNLVKTIKVNSELYEGFKLVDKYIVGGNTGLSEKVSHEIMSFFISNKLISHIRSGVYKWTSKGKEVNKVLINEYFSRPINFPIQENEN